MFLTVSSDSSRAQNESLDDAASNLDDVLLINFDMLLDCLAVESMVDFLLMKLADDGLADFPWHICIFDITPCLIDDLLLTFLSFSCFTFPFTKTRDIKCTGASDEARPVATSSSY